MAEESQRAGGAGARRHAVLGTLWQRMRCGSDGAGKLYHYYRLTSPAGEMWAMTDLADGGEVFVSDPELESAFERVCP